MYNTLGIRMQIGGSDQYGNITAGVEAVTYIAKNHTAPDTPKKTKKEPFGLTTPLLTTSSGEKFGKSAGNALWLDSEMTSTFDLYGYFLRTSDTDVEKYLKLLTFMPIEHISALMKEHKEKPSLRKAQHKLASEFVELVHGKNEAKSAREQHDLIFRKPKSLQQTDSAASSENDPHGVGADALKQAQVNVNNAPKPQLKLPRTVIEHLSIAKILYACGLAESASDGHRLVQGDAIHIGGSPSGHGRKMEDGALAFTIVQPWKVEETKRFLIDDRLLILRRGKHNVRIIELVDDEDYEKLGLSYPGKATVDLQKKIGKIPSGESPGDDLKMEIENDDESDVSLGESNWSPVFDQAEDLEIMVEDPSPEARIERLRRELQQEQDERERRVREKNAPKGVFAGHGQPRKRLQPWEEDKARRTRYNIAGSALPATKR